MEICFGKVSRNLAIQSDADQLWSAIVHELPGLASHRDGLQMRYIDDEGDDICVTTNDELQEAVRVGKETSKGFLSLNLSVTGMGQSTRTSIEESARSSDCDHDDNESTEDEDYERVQVPPTPPTPPTAPANPVQTNVQQVDVLQIIKNAGVSAISEINQAMDSAQTEMNKLLNQLGNTSTKQKETEEELAAVKAELVKENDKLIESEQKVVNLTNDLNGATELLVEAQEQAKNTSIRLMDLEKQVSEKAVWEKKYTVAEQERAKLEHQLTALRSALQALTAQPASEPAITKPAPVKAVKAVPIEAKPVTAEVVSTEVVAASPVVKPAASPELPPPYEKPAPILSPLEKKQQQLRDMGFNLTLEQLKEKLEAHSGNMEHVVISLLS